ncbi:unnamed protein product [Mytilus coruscus]|uniref:MACPF domain-containing protein n=1 Tax=Mytilus coruscus TaxID=42192 RepID=A0A6J8CHK1_MYTCO|nr:unnamed protein product [Mytilus coruscus]
MDLNYKSKAAWNASLTIENIKTGIRACEIHPFNPLAIPDYAYLPSEPSQNMDQNTTVIKTAEAATQTSSASGSSFQVADLETMTASGDPTVLSLDRRPLSAFTVDILVVVDIPGICSEKFQQAEVDHRNIYYNSLVWRANKGNKNGLDRTYWRHIFEKNPKLTSVSQIKFLGTRDFLSIQGQCRFNWEKEALKKLLCEEINKSHPMTYEDWNKREKNDQNRYDDMKGSAEQTHSQTKSNLLKSADWISSSKNIDLNKTLDTILPKSTFRISNVLRQQLDEIAVFKNASAGMAVRGILVNNSNIKNTNAVIDIVGDVCMMAPQMQQSENSLHFFTRQKHDEYHDSMKIFAARGKVSFEAGDFLGLGLSNLYITEKDDKSSLHTEEVFHSRVHSAFIPMIAIKLKLENFTFVPNALKSLKDIEKKYLERKEFDEIHFLFGQFFKNYGSHINVGILHFGGIYEWTAAKYESEHKSKEKFSVDIVNDVFDAYFSGSKLLYNKYVGGRISGDELKKETNFTGHYDDSEFSKVFCSVSQYGGPLKQGIFMNGKVG